MYALINRAKLNVTQSRQAEQRRDQSTFNLKT